jgi:PDZ domain-containing protein
MNLSAVGQSASRALRAAQQTRSRRLVTAAVLLVLIVAGAGTRPAPYALVGPGPTPDLTRAVAAAQSGPHHSDPTLVGPGRLLATTIDAEQLSWAAYVRCRVTGPCTSANTFPLDTSPGAVAAQAAAMTTSQQDAATAALKLTGAAVRFPAQLSADLGDVDGPSAGLMLTLTFVDALTPGDLTGARTVAGTGEIAPDGTVSPISGIAFKVAGAHAAGATVFFAPSSEAAAARAAAPPSMTVVAVTSAGEALAWLCGHGGVSTACPTR